MDYSDFTTKDFILDDYFKEWVLRPREESNIFWNDWLKKNPEKLIEVNEAKNFILRIDFKKYYPSYEVYLENWNKLSQEIEELHGTNELRLNTPPVVLPVEPYKSKSFAAWKAIAASFSAIVFIAFLYLLYLGPSKEIISTQFGETKRVKLSDESWVTLNGNSSITFEKKWSGNETREVWLKGEAFFKVSKKNTGQRFLVHTHNLIVEVLGTEFNVNERSDLTRVVLEEGKVKLKLNDRSNQHSVLMKPGDLVEYTNKKELKKKVVKTKLFTSWKENLLIFENTPLLEVAEILKNQYGFEVVFNNPSYKNKRLVGSFAGDNIDELLWNLEKIYNAKINKDQSQIIF